MGYLHIDNLSKNNRMIKLLRECYAMEKIHGTSAHIKCKGGLISLFSGGCKYEAFASLFDESVFAKIRERENLIIYGEAYGGNIQKMKHVYGDKIKFVAFDVAYGVEETWLTVPKAEEICRGVGLDFVDYKLVECTQEALDAERDRESIQAIKNGLGGGLPREGIVIRPIIELRTGATTRLINKHKRDEFGERKTKSSEIDPEKLRVLEEAEAIAFEWVTPMRLNHVLDKINAQAIASGVALEFNYSLIPTVINAMIEDVEREGAGEIISGKEARRKIGDMTVKLYKEYLRTLPC